jgi:hypothetical protein
MKTLKITRVEKIYTEEPQKVYCFDARPNHQVIQRTKSENLQNIKSIKNFQSLNFGFLFGAGPKTAKTVTIEPNWSLESCIKYVEDNGLQIEKTDGEDDYYLTVAKDVRKKFFESYKGLAKWIQDTQNFARDNGYVQSIYGAFRRLPELRIANSLKDYLKRNPGEKVKYNEDLGMISNLQKKIFCFRNSVLC